jgi:arginine decarboxylase
MTRKAWKEPSCAVLHQKQAPLFDAVRAYAQRVRAPLHVPGHKLGQAAPGPWREFVGESALSIDLTEAPGLDDLHAPEGVIAEAQALAAEAFGAERSFFLVGGTTAGLHGLILTACKPGDTVAVPRHAHRSVLGALILSGANPAWVRTTFHEELDIATNVDMASLRSALERAAAAVLVHPTYYGVASHLSAEIALVHQHGLPVLVDEAHGAHFAFHPHLPPSALSMGADGVVQSTHKTGGSLTQSSMCHLGKGHRLNEERLRAMLRLVQSTSPSYLLMASLDAARRDLALYGQELWERALQLAATARCRLEALPGVRVYPSDDPTKLVIDLRRRGLRGFAASDLLWEQGVAVESAGQGYVLAVLTPGDSPDTVDTLISAVAALPDGPGVPPRPPEPPWPEVVISPREAYLGEKQPVPLAEAAGRIAAELVAPYPPGIPVVAPGERLTPDVLAYLRHAVAAGHHLQGPADSHLQTIQVVRE